MAAGTVRSPRESRQQIPQPVGLLAEVEDPLAAPDVDLGVLQRLVILLGHDDERHPPVVLVIL